MHCVYHVDVCVTDRLFLLVLDSTMEKPQHLTFVGLLSLLVFLVSVTSEVDAGNNVLQCYLCYNIDFINPETNETDTKGDPSCENPTSDTVKSPTNTFKYCFSAEMKNEKGEHLHNYLYRQILIYVAPGAAHTRHARASCMISDTFKIEYASPVAH